jgi:hypothetical protein
MYAAFKLYFYNILIIHSKIIINHFALLTAFKEKLKSSGCRIYSVPNNLTVTDSKR